jgi:hypothetical protein
VEVEAHEKVTLSWEPPLPLPFKHPPKLFSLIPYMLKYDWLNNFINDFKKQLAIYRAPLKGGWVEWVDNIFSMSIGQWIMKDQVNITNCISVP